MSFVPFPRFRHPHLTPPSLACAHQSVPLYPRELLQARRHQRHPPLPRRACPTTAHTLASRALSRQCILPRPASLSCRIRACFLIRIRIRVSVSAVLDEADLLLSFGYEDDLAVIARKLPHKCQRMLVSATIKCGGASEREGRGAVALLSCVGEVGGQRWRARRGLSCSHPA